MLNYSQRLLGWAMISEVPFYLLFGMRLNVMFTLLASLLIIFLLDRKGWAFAATALVMFFPLSLICDWSIIAPVFTMIYYELGKHDKEKLSLILIPGAYFILFLRNTMGRGKDRERCHFLIYFANREPYPERTKHKGIAVRWNLL